MPGGRAGEDAFFVAAADSGIRWATYWAGGTTSGGCWRMAGSVGTGELDWTTMRGIWRLWKGLESRCSMARISSSVALSKSSSLESNEEEEAVDDEEEDWLLVARWLWRRLKKRRNLDVAIRERNDTQLRQTRCTIKILINFTCTPELLTLAYLRVVHYTSNR